MSKNAEIEQEYVENRVPEFLPPLYKKFFISVLNGKIDAPSISEITAIADTQITHDTLTHLTREQKKLLRDDIIDQHLFVFSDSRWHSLSNNTYYIPDGEDHPMRECARIYNRIGLYSGEEADIMAKILSIKPMTSFEKVALLTDPNVYNQIQFTHSNLSEGMLYNGTRHLCDEQAGPYYLSGEEFYESYNYTVNRFTAILDFVRAYQNKSQKETLYGLDIGGSNGLGALDAEKLDPALTVTNLTVDPELAFWPLRGGHFYQYAELLPNTFSEQFDVIFSHLAFRYMRYRDIALENAIRALKVGGILRISFSSDSYTKNGQTREEVDASIDAQFKRMENYHQEGIIQYLPVETDFYDAREVWKESPDFVHGLVFLQKTDHITR